MDWLNSIRRSRAATWLWGAALCAGVLACERLAASDPDEPAGLKRVPFQFEDGDRVILLGATFFEREQQFGHVESALTAATATKHVTFRNLGWDGDTVFAESRGMFETPQVGYQRMIEQVRAEKPTVIVVCYGQNEAMNPAQSTSEFEKQFRQLLTDLSAIKAVVLLMSPHELFPAVGPIPSPSRFNNRLQEYAAAVHSVAESTATGFVDLFNGFASDVATADKAAMFPGSLTEIPADPIQHRDLWPLAATRWTANGMHLNDRGYQAAGLVVRERLLGIIATPPVITVDFDSQTVESESTAVTIRNANWRDGEAPILTFEIQEALLSSLPVVLQLKNAAIEISGNTQTGDRTTSLLRNQKALRDQPESDLLVVPAHPQYEILTKLIVRKNELYFHRWRPQNITYLFGFRKHEQGNNAVEIAQFDPLIAELEKEIHLQKLPAARTVSLTIGK